MAMGRLFGSEQLESAGKQLGQTAYENYRDSVKEFQYIAERGASGAAKGVQGVVNALGYLGQTQNQAKIQQNAQTLAEWGALTGDQNFKGAAQHMNDFAQQVKDAGLQDTISFGDKYQQDIQERYANTDITKTGQFLGDVSETLGGLAPVAAMNAVAPGSGLAVTALSAGGNAAQKALASGASDHQALAYGIAVGGVEAATEKFFDGVAGIFGKGAADNVVKGVAERLAKNETAQAAMVKVANGFGEGFEEFVSEFARRVSNELLIDTDDRTPRETNRDAVYSGLMGLLVGGIIQTADTIGRGGLHTPAQAAEQAAESVVEQIRGQTAGTEYRAEKPRNVELPAVPIINLSMQNVADLNGGRLPRKGNYLRKTAIDRAQRRLGLDKSEAVYIEASNVRRNGEDYVLKLTKSSVSKMLNPSDGSDVPNEAIAILENIERIANNGVYFKNEGDRKGRPQIAGFDHLMTTVYIDNIPTVVDMRVKLVESGKGTEANNVLYYFTPEAITITKDGAAPAAERHAFRGGALPSSNFKLTQGKSAVNSKIWNADRAANAAKPGVKKQSMQNGGAVSARSAVPFVGNGLSQRMAEVETEYNAAIAQAEYTGEYQLAAALYEEKLRVQDALTEQEIHRLRNELEQYRARRDTVANQQYAREQALKEKTQANARKYILALKTSGK